MKILNSRDFDGFWTRQAADNADETETLNRVREIIRAVQERGAAALRDYSRRFDACVPEHFAVEASEIAAAYAYLKESDCGLCSALKLAASNIKNFAEKQKAQFQDFEYEITPGVFTGQRVIPVENACVYVPAGRFPLISSVLMGVIPALTAGVRNLYVTSAPRADGLPDRSILAALAIAAEVCGGAPPRVFAIGGAQAIAAFAYGVPAETEDAAGIPAGNAARTENEAMLVPKADIIVGPGNKYVAAAKRLLSGTVGIDFIAGPTDVLIIAGGGSDDDAGIAAADMLAQAEHDDNAAARILVPNAEAAAKVAAEIERRLPLLSTRQTAQASINKNGLIVIYDSLDDAVRVANRVAPEHLELHLNDEQCRAITPRLYNYGSLFAGKKAAEVLGDYSAGINHTLPTLGTARWTGGLSVRHFLKTVTVLRCAAGGGYREVCAASAAIAAAEGLAGHRESALRRVASD